MSWHRAHLERSLELIKGAAPNQCSGLDVVRYDADGLHGEFGESFKLLESATELHQTPFGTTQQFLYCYCVKVARRLP